VKFEVLTVVLMKIQFFWNVMLKIWYYDLLKRLKLLIH